MMQVIRGGKLEGGSYLPTEHAAIVDAYEAGDLDAAAHRDPCAHRHRPPNRPGGDRGSRQGSCSRSIRTVKRKPPRSGRPIRGSRSSRCTPPLRAASSPASSRTRAARTRTCTAAVRGRSGSTRASAHAEETNARFRYLLERGQTGISVAFDLPTQLGYDSDDPHAPARSAAPASRSTRSRTCASSSRRSRSTRSPPR